MPEFTGIYISDDGYKYLTEDLLFNNPENYYFDPEEQCWYVNLEELLDFLEANNYYFNEDECSIYNANFNPSQVPIFIGV